AVAGADTYQRQIQTLSFDVANAYYNALAAEHATLLAEQVVKQNQTQEDLVTAQLRAGVVSRVDLATAQLPTAQARLALVKAQGTELSAYASFDNTLGLDANTLVRPVDNTPSIATASLLTPTLLTYSAAVARALELRPDYLAAQNAVDAAQANLRAAKLGRFPVLTGDANLSTRSTTSSGTDFRGSNGIGVSLNFPILDHGLTAFQTAQAAADLEKSNDQLQIAKLGVQLSVKQALVGLVSAQSAVGQAQAELSKAQEVLRATQAQYKAGVTTLPLLLNAQVGLTTAETDQLNAVYGLRQAEQTYLLALGESDTGQ
ncbi:MAG: TolC family protein, partial [Candidatus Baltobacteraceae bacterium]